MGVSSCPVGEIGVGVGACGALPLLEGAGSISSVKVVPFWFRVGNPRCGNDGESGDYDQIYFSTVLNARPFIEPASAF